MTTLIGTGLRAEGCVVEAYRLDRYDNSPLHRSNRFLSVVEAYRLDRYDNEKSLACF